MDTEPMGADHAAANTDTQFDGLCGSVREELQVGEGSSMRPQPGAGA